MRSRRPRLSAMLVIGAIVLIASIYVGQKLGDRVMLQTDSRIPIAGAGITPVPIAESTEREAADWKRLSVVAVATDPGFPDPRVTRPPAPRPPPTSAPPTPSPTPSPQSRRSSTYTPPPMPLPLVSHAPGETETEPPQPAASP